MTLTEQERKTLEEVRTLLGLAWSKLYHLDKEVSGEIYNLRSKVNIVELEILNKLGYGKEVEQEESEDI